MVSRRRAVLCLLVAATAPLSAQSLSSTQRADSLLRLLTIAEKVGQMTQLDISAAASVAGTATRAMQLDSAKLQELVVSRGVGSLLNAGGVAMSARQWVEVTSMIQRFARRQRIPIPVLYGIDAVHGHHFMTSGTIFPQNLALAATWNPMLVRRANEITAYETRASGIAWNFSPVLDLGRQPLWSRFYETFGEDVHLASVMGAVAVEAEQRDPTPVISALLQGRTVSMLGGSTSSTPSSPIGPLFVAATGKHFIGYSMPRSGKDRTAAWIPERQLREYFLPPFRAAIDAGVRTIMVNSGDVNGVPVHASRELLTDLLRIELGFRGVVVSDWEDIIRLQTVHRVARTRLDAVRMAVNAGIDMSMVPYTTSFVDDVLALVHAGEITEARIDESARRILALKFELGLFESAGADTARLANANAAPFRTVSRRAAEESITLLKNEGALLPLKQGTNILVTGPGATSLTAQHGGWTYTWQGTDTAMFPTHVQTLLAAMRAQFGVDRVSYVAGAGLTTDADLPAAVAAARDADVVVLALAEPASAEKPGDIDELALPEPQLRLARAMLSVGKPVVLTLFEGRPRTIRDIVDSARAIVLAYQPGPHGGEALARVLAGVVNPSGRLPFTYPRNAGAIEYYDHLASAEISAFKPTGGYAPEWDFGHGLSYTTFAYDSIQVAKKILGPRDTLAVSVIVTNTGTHSGMEVVQVYTRQLVASVSPPVRRLRDFEKISLAPGERRTVTFALPVQRLAFVGRDNRLGVEPGEFEIMIAGRTLKFIVE